MITREFVLWNNCSLNCDFCNLHKKHQSTNDEQMESLNAVQKCIENQTDDFNVLFVGGEIFNGLNINLETKLLEIYKHVMLNKHIHTIYFNTNLLYKISEDSLLYNILSFAKEHNRLKDIHFTTSDDYIGRWANDKQRDLFYGNIRFLKENFKDINIIVNSIMMKEFVKSDYNIKEYMDEYNVKVNLLPYINLNNHKEFLPTRHEYTEFILKQMEYNYDYILSWIDMWSHDKEVQVYQYNPTTKILENVTETEKPCGKHNANFSNCFADSDECFLCYLENFK